MAEKTDCPWAAIFWKMAFSAVRMAGSSCDSGRPQEVLMTWRSGLPLPSGARSLAMRVRMSMVMAALAVAAVVPWSPS